MFYKDLTFPIEGKRKLLVAIYVHIFKYQHYQTPCSTEFESKFCIGSLVKYFYVIK